MFSKKLVRVLFVILLALINIILLSVSANYPHRFTVLDRVVLAGIVPFQTSVTRVTRHSRKTWNHYFYLIGVREECDRLRTLLARSETEKSRSLESELSCQRLQALLDMSARTPYAVLPAEVAGVDPTGWFKTIVINRGTRDGIARGMAVAAAGGLVGHVIKVSDASAMVLLIIDPTSAVDALVQRSRYRGIVEGESNDRCRLKYVVRKADVQMGDAVVATGLDGIFPKGLPIGTISGVMNPQTGLFQEAKLLPFVDFSRLEEVLVILERQKPPQFSEGP
jgi:rod shape-determining protein MreC